MLDDIDRKLIARACGDIGDSPYPFHALAAELGMDEADIITRLNAYKHDGVLRRFGAILRHQQAGYSANGMSVWNIPDVDAAAVGKRLAECPDISHCYERPRFDDWPYNLYGMIHGHSEDEVLSCAKRIATGLSLDDYDVLFSIREFKKTSMVYR
jgi:DNA-binding Lrp family transcriptional regulator